MGFPIYVCSVTIATMVYPTHPHLADSIAYPTLQTLSCGMRPCRSVVCRRLLGFNNVCPSVTGVCMAVLDTKPGQCFLWLYWPIRWYVHVHTRQRAFFSSNYLYTMLKLIKFKLFYIIIYNSKTTCITAQLRCFLISHNSNKCCISKLVQGMYCWLDIYKDKLVILWILKLYIVLKFYSACYYCTLLFHS